MKLFPLLATLAAGLAASAVLALPVYTPLRFASFLTWVFLTSGHTPFVFALPAFAFWLWHPKLFLGSGEVPLRSLFGLSALIAVSLVWHALIFRVTAQDMGRGFAYAVAGVNLAAVFMLVALAVLARRRERFGSTLLFHFAVAVWVCSVAFPGFGAG